jgi:hypothetical protein
MRPPRRCGAPKPRRRRVRAGIAGRVGRRECAGGQRPGGTTESFTTIAAPFDGMVTEKMVEPGNMASPGLPLLRLEDTRGFASRSAWTNHASARFATATASRSFSDPDRDRERTHPGHGGRGEPGVEADARAFLVKIALPDTTGFDPANSARRDLKGRRGAR